MKLADIYPRRKPIPQDLDTDFEFYRAEGEEYDAFARRRYKELLDENRKQFSELCNQAMHIDQLQRKIENMQEKISTIEDIYGALRHLSELMGVRE